MIGIARYEQYPSSPEFSGYVPNLKGVDHDLSNTLRLFKDRLQYDCFPTYNLAQPKMRWTKTELEELLVERANALEQNLVSAEGSNKYDGLICVVSCHGIEGQLITVSVCNSTICGDTCFCCDSLTTN